MSSESPQWKKPSDIMKVMRKKRSVSKSPAVSRPANSCNNKLRKSPHRGKRKNPFGCSPRKKQNLNAESSHDVTSVIPSQQSINGRMDGVLLDILNKKDQGDEKNSKTIIYSLPEEPSVQKISNKTSQELGTVKKSQEVQTYYPQDWCLKMKTRYVSSSPFSWCYPLKTVDESNGMKCFVQNTPQLQDLKGKEPPQSEDAKAHFHKSCLYWTHPNIPWLKMFPRITTDNKIGKTSAVLQDKEVLDSLMSDWTESFTSVFHLLRSGSCPYFYMCCHQFTVAFFAAHTRSDQMEAVLTPTSRGLREALKAEEIEFTMPLKPRRTSGEKDLDLSISQNVDNVSQVEAESKSSIENTETSRGDVEKSELDQDEEDDDEDIEHTDDGAASWLETLGLDKKDYRSLDPNKVKLQRDSFRLIDNRPESTALVVGHEVQALFNFLLNCRSCVANTGVQAGIPPTLISSTTFKGATLKTLKVKQSSLRQQNPGDYAFSLEVTGPMLPSAYTNLNHLLTLTQIDYCATYNVHEQSTPLNVTAHSVDDEEKDDVLVESVDGSRKMHLGKEAIRELNYNGTGFTWSKY